MDIRKTLTDVLFGGGIRVAVRLRGLVFIPLIIGYLGVGGFGAYTQILAVVGLASLVFSMGLYKSLVRYGHREGRTADLYFSLLCASVLPSLVVAVLLIVGSTTVSETLLQTDQYGTAYRLGAALIVTRTMFRHARNYFRVDSRIKLYALLEGIRAYAMILAVTVSLVFTATGLDGLFASMVAADLLLVVALHVQIIREIGVVVPTFADLHGHLAYALPSTWSSLASEITTRADRVLIGVFLGDIAVGVYAVTAQIATGISMYIMPIYQTFFPEFSKLIDDDRRQECASYLRSGTRYFLIIAVPSVGGLALVGPSVISLLTQAKVTPSPVLIAVLAAGNAVMGVEIIYGSMMDAAEETGRRAAYRTVGATANVGLNLLVIPAFGVVGAAAATVLATMFVAGLTVRRTERLVPTTVPWLTVLRCIGATGLMVAVATSMSTSIVGTVLISVPVYLAVLVVSRELSLGELQRTLRT